MNIFFPACLELIQRLVGKHEAYRSYLEGEWLPETLPLTEFIKWGQDNPLPARQVLLYITSFFIDTEDVNLMCIASWSSLRRVFNECDGNPERVTRLWLLQKAKEDWEATLRPKEERVEEFEKKSRASWDETVKLVGKMAVSVLDGVEARDYDRYKLVLVASVPEDVKKYINEHTPTKDQ